jgi:16S rRNA (guanine527-N7)-methyltransferase
LEKSRISHLLSRFIGELRLTEVQLDQISDHLDLLLKWNSKTNLTAIRDPEEIVRRHFGESLFAGRMLYPNAESSDETLIDFGSGAGFPGIPIKILVPTLQVTLIESQNKKATFLREVIRALGLKEIQVHVGRAEQSGLTANTVTMRAVEKFEESLPVAASMVEPGGRFALLIGAAQVGKAKSLTPLIPWSEAVRIPGSEQRVLLIGKKTF